MTDRIKGFTVIFEKDIREDDAQATLDAIMHIKGVLSVDAVTAQVSDAIERQRALIEARTAIFDLLQRMLSEP